MSTRARKILALVVENSKQNNSDSNPKNKINLQPHAKIAPDASINELHNIAVSRNNIV